MDEKLTIHYPALPCGNMPMYCPDTTHHTPHDWPADWPVVGGTYHCYGLGAAAMADPDACPVAGTKRV